MAVHHIPVKTFVYHPLCEGIVGIPSAVVLETPDMNKMIYCFNCHGKIYVNETYWPDPIYYEDDEVMQVKKHIAETDDKCLPNLISIPQKWVVIDAPTGAGKTTTIERLLEENREISVLVVAKFTTLVRNLAEKYEKIH